MSPSSPTSPVRRPGIVAPTIEQLDIKRKIARGDDDDDASRVRKKTKLPIADRPLFVDDRVGGWTNETLEGRHLSHFLNWSTSDESVGRGAGFADCVRQLLVPELAEAYLKKNYPELHREMYRDDRFEDLFAKLEEMIEEIDAIEEIDETNGSSSETASKLCDAYHTTFGDFEYADDEQARRVTRLVRETVYYENLDDDDAKKKLLDEVYPEVVSADDDEDDEDDEDDDETEDGEIVDPADPADPEPVSAFVARHLAETSDDAMNVGDVIRTRDDDDDDVIDYQKSFEEFLEDPFTFPA